MIRLAGSGAVRTYVSDPFLHTSNNSGVNYQFIHNFGVAPHVIEVQFMPGSQFVRLHDYFTVSSTNYGWDAIVNGDTDNTSTWIKIWNLRGGTEAGASAYGAAYCRVILSLLS